MRQALELALEALQFALHVGFPESSESQIKKGEKASQQHRAAITAIKEALAQPEQEPVAWLQIGVGPLHEGDVIARTTKPKEWNSEWWKFEPLYTTPPQRKPLTDEEIMNIAKVSCIGISPHEDTLNFAKVIEAVHGIKELK